MMLKVLKEFKLNKKQNEQFEKYFEFLVLENKNTT